ncbi:MAG: hypothetical protein AAF141_16280, partial [Pseudomonadota bacterium]
TALTGFADSSGAKGVVNVYNSTPGFTVTGLYTNAGHGWTRDWLENVTLTPGEGAVALFRSDPVRCHQRLRVGWLSASGHEFREHPVAVNICALSNIYLDGDGIFFD